MGLSILKNKGEKVFNWLKKPNYILIIAWVLPIGILLTILYLNFLPFGYNKTLTIDVGTSGDDKGQFYLDTSRADLGSRQELDGKTFRYLDGLAYAVYKPKVVLNNATIEAALEADEGVNFILPPDLTDVKWDYEWDANNIAEIFEIKTIESDLFKRFSNAKYEEIAQEITIENLNKELAIEVEWLAGEQSEILSGDVNAFHNQKTLTVKYKDAQIDYKLPDFFLGKNHNILIAFEGKNLHIFVDGIAAGKKSLKQEINKEGSLKISKASNTDSIKLRKEIRPEINIKDDCVYLDGKSRLVMPETADKFEEGSFTVYAKWTPELASSSQQIIGHFNWEIWQNEKSVSFQVGRMSTSTGKFYKVSYPIEENFFNKEHDLIAIYNPISINNQNGYIELFIDDVFAGREYFADETIWKDYGKEDLSIGWTTHNYERYPYFKGSICAVKYAHKSLNQREGKFWEFSNLNEFIKLPIRGSGSLREVQLNVKK